MIHIFRRGKPDPASSLKIGIAQTMNLGDVVATLPMAGLIKQSLPHSRIHFLARPYAKPLLDACTHVDGFTDAGAVTADPRRLAELELDILLNPFPSYEIAAAAYAARVPVRVGNLRRTRMYRLCNRFVSYGRNNSPLHEAQIVIKNLAALGMPTRHSLSELASLMGLTRTSPLEPQWGELLRGDRFNLILHPKSNGNGREWPIEYFLQLAQALPDARYRIFITGVAAEGERLHNACPELFQLPQVQDLTGRMSLAQFISFIGAADGFVGAGTGPLHIAAALGVSTLGLFPPRRGMQASRWQPIGVHASYLSLGEVCKPGPGNCPKDTQGEACRCMRALAPAQVLREVLSWPKSSPAIESRLTSAQ